MKKNFLFRLLAATAAFALTLGFVSCGENEEPVTPPVEDTLTVELSRVSVAVDKLTVLVEASKSAETCYIDVVPEGENEPSVQEVIEKGDKVAPNTEYTAENLEPGTTYVFLAVATAGDRQATDRLELTTKSDPAEEGITELNYLLEAVYSTNNTAGAGNYQLVIANTSMLEWEGDAEMVLNFYNEPDADPLNAVLPNGVYEASADYEPFTYNPSNTYLSIVVGEELLTDPIIGSITVEREGPEYTITVDGILFTQQTPIKARYKGAIQFVQGSSSEYERFDTPQEITFEQAQGRYWGSWFYPFADDLGIEFFQGEFDENNTLVKGYYLHLTSIYMPKLEDYNASQIDLANGVYHVTIDRPDYIRSYAQPFTFDYGQMTSIYEQLSLVGTYVTYVDRSQNIQKAGMVTGGTVTVTGSGANTKLEFDFVTEEGISITGSYQGSLNLSNYNDNDLNQTWTSRPWTTLTEDHTYEWKPETEALAFLLGDYIKEGTDTWMLMIMASNSKNPNGYGDYFTTELMVDVENGFNFPTGTFNVDWSLEPNTMIPGFMDYAGSVAFTYYGDLTADAEGYSSALAAISGGTVTITKEGDEYKFVFDMVDDGGNKVTGEWQGSILTEDLRDAFEEGGDEDHDHAHALAKQALRVRR